MVQLKIAYSKSSVVTTSLYFLHQEIASGRKDLGMWEENTYTFGSQY